MMKLKIMRATHSDVKAITCAVFCLLLCAALTPAQSSKLETDKQKPKPTLSGTWVLDEEQTKRDNSKSTTAPYQLTLVISQREPEIKMTRKVVSGGQEKTRESIYYSDGRGETNLGTTISTTPNARDEEIKSKTKWRGDKLITSATIRTAAAGTLLIWDIIEEWKLSGDGQTLTQTTIIKPENSGPDIVRMPLPGRTLPPGEMIFVTAGNNKFKRVFRRVSN